MVEAAPKKIPTNAETIKKNKPKTALRAAVQAAM
jgi:hypothetical protein